MHSFRKGENGFSHDGSHLMLLTKLMKDEENCCPDARNCAFWDYIIQTVKDKYFEGKLWLSSSGQMTEKEMKMLVATLILMKKEFIRVSESVSAGVAVLHFRFEKLKGASVLALFHDGKVSTYKNKNKHF